MFQGSPNEAARNRVPLAYEPSTIDAILLTHAHLDHCGMLPVVARAGYRGPIHATRATVELASLVLLDSGKVQEEHAKDRRKRAERAGPARTARGCRAGVPGQPRRAGRRRECRLTRRRASGAASGRRPSGEATAGHGRQTIRCTPTSTRRRASAASRRTWTTAIFEPLYTVDDAAAANALFRGPRLRRAGDGCSRHHRHVP